ncbi:hypothetical protein ACLKA7_002162 [Drosophila subpalustris]
MVRSWIYNLKREELLQYGSEFRIELTGTVDAMRREFGEWVEANEGHAPHAERLDALARKHGRNSPFRAPVIQLENLDVNKTAASLAKMDFASTSEEARRLEDQKREERRAPWGTSSTFPQNQTNTENRTNLERNPVRDYAAVAKQVREWSFRFDGSSKPLEFLEQVEWSAETYGLDLNLVPRAIPELLKGTALKWYIANNEHWRTWASFVASFQEFFLPRDYFSKLLEEVSRRKQGIDEPFKRYMVEMQTLMRPLRYSKEREREQIYTCSLPDFRAFARPYQNGSLIELMQLAEEFEELERDRERLRQHTRQNRSRLMAMEDSRPRGNNAPCTRCADHTSTQPQPTPRAFSGPPTHTASGSQERADADRSSSTRVVGALRAEGHRLTATVQIGNKSYNATIDTGATSSFVSEELAVTLCEEGFELGATQRQVRLADGRSSGVSEHVEVQIQLGDRQVDLPLLVLPGVIDELVLGWDFLSHMGAILECAGIQVRIPARRRHIKGREERLSVVNTQDKTTRIQENQEQGTRDNQSTQEQTMQEQGTLQRVPQNPETRKTQDHATAEEQTMADEPGHTTNGGISCEHLHADPAIDTFLRQEIAAFATMTGTSPITEHRIVMHDDRPIKQRYFPKNPKMQEEINKQVDELLAKGCIEPSNSPHSAPIVMVKKKTGKWRLCVDFRQLNSRATAAALQKAFRERILARFGVPKVLITDNGAQFTSRTFKNFLQDLGVKHQYTAPYTPQENPTERANRTVKTMIAQFAGANQRCWDEALPEITLAVNTSVTASTGYSPAFVTQGREPRLPQALFDEVTIGTGQVAQEPRENAGKLKEIFEIVRRSLEKAAQDQARHYNLRRRSWKPSVGDKVWLKEHHLSNAAEGFAAKLAPRFGGPYRVVDFVSPVICKLQSPMDNKTKRAHISDLKPHVTAEENRSE